MILGKTRILNGFLGMLLSVGIILMVHLQIYPPPHDEGCVGEAYNAASDEDHYTGRGTYGLAAYVRISDLLGVLADCFTGN